MRFNQYNDRSQRRELAGHLANKARERRREKGDIKVIKQPGSQQPD